MDEGNPIWTTLDLDADGKQIGTLQVPHSVTRSAYGMIPIPIAVIRNGAGPTLLAMAGCHGDEWEGQIALARLIRNLEPDHLSGRMILLPSANSPACQAATRESPIDGVNLNRCFPGQATGTPTRQIAHYIASVLMPLADVFVDLHSGGASLDYLPCTFTCLTGEPGFDRRALDALDAFGGDLAFAQSGTESTGFAGTSAVSALRHGTVFVSGEFGGSGRIDPQGVAFAERGLRRLACHLGLLKGPAPAPDAPLRMLDMDDPRLFTFAPAAGVFEPAVRLGDTVAAGQAAGWLHNVEDPAAAPRELRFAAAGLVMAIRATAHALRGDCLVHLARDA